MITKGMAANNPDGSVQARVECYSDEQCSRATVQATFKGCTGQMTFTADQDGVKVSFAGDQVSIAGKDAELTATDKARVSGNSLLLTASDKALFSADELIIQALSKVMNVTAAGKLSLGSRENVEIRALANILIKAIQVEVNAILKIKGLVTIGQGIRRVACIGDAVACAGGGTITGPGSTNLMVD